jgi:glycosyltransferase involved in cell wall biosynthesis
LEELVKSYQKAQATLFASIDEPFGMVPIESMACGTIAI